MTRYHFDNQEKKQQTSRKKVLGIFSGVVILAAVIVFVVGPAIRSVMRGPAWLRTAIDDTAQLAVSSVTPKKVVIEENDRLKAQIETYQAEHLELQMLRDDNQKLRTELSYAEPSSSIILAAIIAKPNQSLYNSLIIDRGTDDGIVVGQWVTTQGTVGLGRIVSATGHTATVQLFSSSQFSGDMVIKNQNITVPATGRGGGNFEIHIPREIVVTDGDILVFPENQKYAIGIVKSITFDPRDPFQTVLARMPVNVQELGYVQVVR